MWLIGTKLVRVALSHKIFLSDPGKGETNPGIQGAVRSRPESAPVILSRSRSRLSFSPLNGWVASEIAYVRRLLDCRPCSRQSAIAHPSPSPPVSLPIHHSDELACTAGLLMRRIDGVDDRSISAFSADLTVLAYRSSCCKSRKDSVDGGCPFRIGYRNRELTHRLGLIAQVPPIEGSSILSGQL